MTQWSSLYERDAVVYDAPASYVYDPPITARELLAQLLSERPEQ